MAALTLYSVSNYNFGTKDAKIEKDISVQDRLKRMQTKYQKEGTRRSVDAILLVHEHHHPHVLLLQIGSAFFKLPGGRLRPGEDEMQGLKRKLNNNLAPTAASLAVEWDLGECIGTYWRPSFDVTMYPYLPAHVTKPKEVRKLFIGALPEHCYFAVPRNLKLLAVPLFELYDNMNRYGPIISAIPHLLGRLRLTLAGDVIAPAIKRQEQALAQPKQDEEVYG